MHELSICQALMDQVTQVAQTHSADAVDQIVLQIGPLSGVEPQLLQQAFPIAAAGTVAEKAVLTIESMPLVVTCTQCGAESAVQANKLVCQHCGDFRTQLISGDEMLLKQVGLVVNNEDNKEKAYV